MSTWPPGWLAGLQSAWLTGCLTSGSDCRVERPSVPGRLLWVHGRLVGWLAYSLPGLQVVSLVGSDCRVERPSVPGRLLWVHGRLVGWLAYSLPGLQVVSLVGSDCRVERPSAPGRLLWVLVDNRDHLADPSQATRLHQTDSYWCPVIYTAFNKDLCKIHM